MGVYLLISKSLSLDDIDTMILILVSKSLILSNVRNSYSSLLYYTICDIIVSRKSFKINN